MKKLYILILLTISTISFAQKKNKFALINGVAHIGNGTVIENCLIVVDKDKFEMVGSIVGVKMNISGYDTVIDLEGKHVYPGLINANNVLGLHDAFSVRATRDLQDVGYINPHVRALIAYNTDNKIVPTIKTNGILYTQVTPRGGMICGQSSIMALEGWNWEDAELKADDGIHLNFPQYVTRSEDDKDDKSLKNYNDQLNTLNTFMKDAWAYYLNGKADEKNLRFEAMRGVFSGDKRLYVHADKAKDILMAINFCKTYSIKNPVLVGVKEVAKVLKDIKNSAIPAMVVRVHDLPDKTDDDIDAVYKLPALLQKEGILFCLSSEGDTEMEAMNCRNLPFLAGSAVAYGLTKEEALMSISYNTAKIMGIDKKLGSLEDNKIASFVISVGDILDMKSSIITTAYIAGKEVNLKNQQTELYLKYKTKYGIK
ncbi:MAG: amidohydrolase family protein [Bacteroidota bacterium]|nr:amidohydrolase family protein [Bacteroidota bacterium]